MKTKLVYIILVALIIIGLIVARSASAPKTADEVSSPLDTFAQCISDAGAKFYGAYWCPHCQSQKKAFENSKKLPYIECSTPNGQGQVQICAEAKVTGYPTWDFADGSRLDGELTFEKLSEKTNCPVPVQ